MNKIEFLNELKVALNTERELLPEMELNTLEEWDSLSIVCVITMFSDNLDINLDYDEIGNFKTIQDLMDKAGIK